VLARGLTDRRELRRRFTPTSPSSPPPRAPTTWRPAARSPGSSTGPARWGA